MLASVAVLAVNGDSEALGKFGPRWARVAFPSTKLSTPTSPNGSLPCRHPFRVTHPHPEFPSSTGRYIPPQSKSPKACLIPSLLIAAKQTSKDLARASYEPEIWRKTLLDVRSMHGMFLPTFR